MKKTVLLVLLLALSCSIKEDRTGCPYRLTVVLTEAGGVDGEDMVLGISGLHRVTAFCGDEGMVLRSGVLSVPYGEACGPLMARAESIECVSEGAIDTVRLRKQHIVLTFRLDPSGSGVRVKSPWNGLSVSDLSPAAGDYRALAVRTGPGEFKVLLPRQGDASMVADILGGDGAVAQTLPVGNMLLSAGYDFEAENLDDAIICLDKAPDGFSVSISEWEKGEADEVNV